MHVVSKKRLKEFWLRHPDSETDLLDWYKIAKKAKWTNFADLRATFRSADKVGKCVVFNICHNKYRLITIVTRNRITKKWQRVLIRCVLTHKEYDKDAWKKDCFC